MHRVTNTSRGPRVVHTTGGSRVIEPGGSVEAEFDEGNLAAMERRDDYNVVEIDEDSPHSDSLVARRDEDTGHYVIFDGDETFPDGRPLTKKEALKFNRKSRDEQTEWLKETA